MLAHFALELVIEELFVVTNVYCIYIFKVFFEEYKLVNKVSLHKSF